MLQPSSSSRSRSEEHTSELQSRGHLVCRLLLEKKNNVVVPTYNRPTQLHRTLSCLVNQTHLHLEIIFYDIGLPDFFFNDTATTEIYTLSLHDALPISSRS